MIGEDRLWNCVGMLGLSMLLPGVWMAWKCGLRTYPHSVYYAVSAPLCGIGFAFAAFSSIVAWNRRAK